MAIGLNIGLGETRQTTGLRVALDACGETAWMHGKTLDLGPDHAIAWVDGPVEFITASGTIRRMGSFPAWVVSSPDRKTFGLMFNARQFDGGEMVIRRKHTQQHFPISLH